MNATKTLLFLVISSFVSTVVAQFPEKDIRNLLGKDTSITENFINNTIKVGQFLDCDPWDDTKPCTDICDPWENPTCKEQIKKLKTKKARQQQLIKIMKHFEKALLKGAGGKIITRRKVLATQKKHPGYNIKAMRNRYQTYMFFEAWPCKIKK